MMVADTGTLPRIKDNDKDLIVPLLNLSSKKIVLTPKSSPKKIITVSPPENNKSRGSPLSPSGAARSPRSASRRQREPLGSMNSPGGDARVLKNVCVSPVRTSDRTYSANNASRRGEGMSTNEDKIRANLKSLREASSSANPGEKFDVNVVTRTAVKTFRRNQRSISRYCKRRQPVAVVARRR